MKNQFPNEFSDRSHTAALMYDQHDPLAHFRQQFQFPAAAQKPIYFTGHSLGLMPLKAREYVNAELDQWGQQAVEGHFRGKFPWLPYHEFLTPLLARLVGAKETEVVAMNSLTVNLHLMLVSFYRPQGKKNKILIENNTFPSDRYAIESQIRWHGLDPKEVLIELRPTNNPWIVDEEDLLDQISAHKDTLALVLLGNCNYLSGQKFDFLKITQVAHELGAYCGFNLAHGAGNLLLELNRWQMDFAVWCSYKYLNSGPGGIAGAFVHENHHAKADWPRLAGWWGHNKKSRFQMGPKFDPMPTVESWQLSNPPIFQLASHRAALEIFDQASMLIISEKAHSLTSYFEFLLSSELGEKIEVITPKDRGSMLCLQLKNPSDRVKKLTQKGVYVDYREPGIIRATPAPLYNSYSDVHRFVGILKEELHDSL